MLGSQFGCFGYRRVTDLLRLRGWPVHHKRVKRVWQREGLTVPATPPRRGRLRLNDGACVRLRPGRPRHVWACDFVQLGARDGRGVRLLTIIGDYTRECLAIRTDRSNRSAEVVERMAELMVTRGVPGHIRSDNAPDLTARAVLGWRGWVGVWTLCVSPGSPWEYGFIESFTSDLRYELRGREIFYTLLEVQVLAEQNRQTHSRVGPHSSLGHRPPAPETCRPADPLPVLVGLTQRMVQLSGACHGCCHLGDMSASDVVAYQKMVQAHTAVSLSLRTAREMRAATLQSASVTENTCIGDQSTGPIPEC